jgi:hypothetical protein
MGDSAAVSAGDEEVRIMQVAGRSPLARRWAALLVALAAGVAIVASGLAAVAPKAGSYGGTVTCCNNTTNYRVTVKVTATKKAGVTSYWASATMACQTGPVAAVWSNLSVTTKGRFAGSGKVRLSGGGYQTDPGPFLIGTFLSPTSINVGINDRVSGHAVACSGYTTKGVLKLGG